MPSERIRIGQDYYLLAAAIPTRGRRLVLNHGDSFAIFNEVGDVPLVGYEPFGLFSAGTRVLDRFELRLNGSFPMLLSAAVTDDGIEHVTFITNPDERRGGELAVERNSVAVERRKVLVDGALFETLLVHNYAARPLDLTLGVLFSADFADIFELRGLERAARGQAVPPHVQGRSVVYGYRGLDDVERSVELSFEPEGWQLAPESAELALHLPAGAEARATVAVRCRIGTREPAVPDGASAVTLVRGEREATASRFASVVSRNDTFEAWIATSRSDLALLCAERPTGPYPYAGIPWFATVFGRDGLVTGLQTLAFAPAVAAGVLRALAAMQGRESDPVRDEEPGKILHELRLGEMAARGEIPFGRYYGSVDSTPLFLVVLAAYAQRTADLELVRDLWPAALAAVAWIRNHTDARGYVTYQRRTPRGLVNQGWKDSHDSISHASGALAEPPIALCEVQAYVYDAYVGVADLARRLGDDHTAVTCLREAAALRRRFSRDFWLEDEGVFALALDGDGQACRVVTSNAGQCLLGGIADPEQAARVVARLMRDDCFCGWGIRTLSSGARRYNPMSYHNGSVWPHDNALIAAGFARHGFGGRAAEILSALLDAGQRLEEGRLPELFCGFPRIGRQEPVPYPVACRPQAWAAGSVFLLLQSVLGLSIDAWKRQVTFSRTVLPPALDHLEIRDLRVGAASLDVCVERGRAGAAAIELLGRHGDLEVIIRK
jgi:glycogen debranching enzyme